MKKHILITLAVIMLTISAVLINTLTTTSAYSTDFVAIPSSAFSGQTSGHGGNRTGTARTLKVLMFAPVNLPHGATVTSFKCGGSSIFKRQVAFRLRRNDPQQANLDMAIVKTSIDKVGFQFLSTNSIKSGRVNNSRFNYYIVAEVENLDVRPPTRPICVNGCSVGFCSIGYTTPS